MSTWATFELMKHVKSYIHEAASELGQFISWWNCRKKKCPSWRYYITQLWCQNSVMRSNIYCGLKALAINLSNQLSNFPKNWGTQGSKTEFHEFHKLMLRHFQVLKQPCWKTCKCLGIKSAKMVLGNQLVKLDTYLADFVLKTCKSDPEFVR